MQEWRASSLSLRRNSTDRRGSRGNKSILSTCLSTHQSITPSTWTFQRLAASEKKIEVDRTPPVLRGLNLGKPTHTTDLLMQPAHRILGHKIWASKSELSSNRKPSRSINTEQLKEIIGILCDNSLSNSLSLRTWMKSTLIGHTSKVRYSTQTLITDNRFKRYKYSFKVLIKN